MTQRIHRFGAALVLLALLSTADDARAVGTISYLGKTADVTDFQALGLGSAGFWFAQFDAPGPVTNGPVDANDRNSLPGWIVPEFDPNSADYSFGSQVFSEGGNTGWNLFTLPDGAVGLSGTLVDPEADNNSNNTIRQLKMGAGMPASFLFHVVTDNTNNTHDSANRIRVRGEDTGGSEADFRVNLTTDDFNAIADVYTFRFDGWNPDDFIKMQLNSGVPGIDPGIAGIMFDVIPEPTSLTLVAFCVTLCGWRRRNRSL